MTSTLSNVVVKLGTSSLTDADGVIDTAFIDRVAAELAELRAAGHRVTLVSSGAIAAGLPALNLDASARPTDAVALQAISSIGQPTLLETWRRAFAPSGLVVGQILLAPHNFGERSQYLHARSTLAKLHDFGVIPIINENDAVTDAEIRYGDNDRIAALVANMVDADTLVMLTDTDGVLTADPNIDPDASLIEEIADFAEVHTESLGGAGSARGSGGMASKLTAAKIARRSGIRTVIANAKRSHVVRDAVAGTTGVGTTVLPATATTSARKLWIEFALAPVARVVVDEGAQQAMAQGGRSLLAVGVVEVDGSFERRDPIEVSDRSGGVFAKGLARISAADVSAGEGGQVVIHVDDLVLLG